jgi:hypothetical protein
MNPRQRYEQRGLLFIKGWRQDLRLGMRLLCRDRAFTSRHCWCSPSASA